MSGMGWEKEVLDRVDLSLLEAQGCIIWTGLWQHRVWYKENHALKALDVASDFPLWSATEDGKKKK